MSFADDGTFVSVVTDEPLVMASALFLYLAGDGRIHARNFRNRPGASPSGQARYPAQSGETINVFTTTAVLAYIHSTEQLHETRPLEGVCDMCQQPYLRKRTPAPGDPARCPACRAVVKREIKRLSARKRRAEGRKT